MSGHSAGRSLAPDVSVAVVVINAQDSVAEFVEALFRQEAKVTYEVVVCVGPSSDGTLETVRALMGRYASLRVVTSDRASIPHQRNLAVRSSSGALILTCDADDHAHPSWIQGMAESLASAPVVAGRLVLDAGSEEGGGDPAETAGTYPFGYLPFGQTANLGFRRSVYDAVGGFDESIRYGEDVDFTWSAQQAGFALARASATVSKSQRSDAYARGLQHFCYGRSAPALYAKHRRRGMPRQLALGAKSWLWLVGTLPFLVQRGHRFRWLGVFGQRVGRLVGSFESRVFYP